MSEWDSLALQQMSKAVATYVTQVLEIPEYRDWKSEKLKRQIALGMGIDVFEPLDSFTFSTERTREIDAVESYIDLCFTYFALRDCQFYFRRYPFGKIGPSKNTHLRYVCEMYFSRFYEFSERLKRCLNKVNEAISPLELSVGPLIKTFGREFRSELRARNTVHHHTSFDDDAIGSLRLTNLMGIGEADQIDWKAHHNAHYRRLSAHWAARAKRQSERIEQYLEAVADAMLRYCAFLDAGQEPPGHSV